MAVATATLTALSAHLTATNAPVEYVDAVNEIIAQRNNRTAKATAKRAEKSENANVAIANAVESIINNGTLNSLEVIMNSDVRIALEQSGIEKVSVQKATKAIALMVERGYLMETVPPKGVSCRCYRLA